MGIVTQFQFKIFNIIIMNKFCSLNELEKMLEKEMESILKRYQHVNLKEKYIHDSQSK